MTLKLEESSAELEYTPSEAYMSVCKMLVEEYIGEHFIHRQGNLYAFTDDRSSVTSSCNVPGWGGIVAANFNMQGTPLKESLESEIKAAIDDPLCLGVVPCSVRAAEAVKSLGLVPVTPTYRVTRASVTLTVYNKGEQK
ncbi:MAG TPA: hypothetical protein VJK72_05905 [Candidatus Nanoarchaeia archaeon]|nr:hypothetical protein [Candidatus Nanoarchaeia archaeon]